MNERMERNVARAGMAGAIGAAIGASLCCVGRSPRFCATEQCPVVYFGERGTTSFTESDLTVRVHAKHPLDDTVPVCYCFGFDAASIARAPAGAVRAEVAAEVRAGHCACEVRNPKGACCLGDIVAAERRLRG